MFSILYFCVKELVITFSLTGETAADTKVAVEKLKNTILLESEEENEKK